MAVNLAASHYGSMSATQKQLFVFVSHADSGDVHTLALSGDGHLTPRHITELGGILMPMAMSACGQWLYVVRRSDPLAVVSLQVDANTGALRPMCETALPASMAYISIDESGKTLFAASYQHDLLSLHAIASNGHVEASHQVIQTGRHAHSVIVAPDNRYVLAAILGSDQVLQLPFDSSKRKLASTQIKVWSAPAGSGPRHLRFHPDGTCFYLLNELDASIDVFDYCQASGKFLHKQRLASMPANSTSAPWAADLHITPDGKFLYTSERNTSTLGAFSIDPIDHTLHLITHVETEAQPRGFAITPDGQYLLAAGQRSHHLSLYTIDPNLGTLTLQQRVPTGLNPNWIEISK